jgi:hypothetical protein
MALGMPLILVILEKMLLKHSNHGRLDAPIILIFFFSIS